jgi:hypothetical protein
MHLAVAGGSDDAGTVGLPAEVGLAGTHRAAFSRPMGVMAITRALGKSKMTVWRWQERYLAKGTAGLRFFGLITKKRIRRGVFRSVPELVTAIRHYLEHHNADPKPFVWTASAAAIPEKVARGRQALESVH